MFVCIAWAQGLKPSFGRNSGLLQVIFTGPKEGAIIFAKGSIRGDYFCKGLWKGDYTGGGDYSRTSVG